MNDRMGPTATGNFELVPLDELFDNHDEFSGAPSEALVGRSLDLALDNGVRLLARFTETQVQWSADGPLAWGTSGEDAYEAVRVRDGIFSITVDRLADRGSILAVVDLGAGRVAIALTELVGADTAVSERSSIVQGTIDGAAAAPLARTDDLVGMRVHYRYSSTHAFEHIYVDRDHYVWHGLEGPEAGFGGFEPAEAYKIADQLYLFTWHERASPFNGTIVIDLRERNSTGRLCGWHMEQHRAMSVPTGATTTVLNKTTYEGL